MAKKGFYINLKDCMGCCTCQIACKDKNNLPIGILFRKVTSYETGKFPNPKPYHYPATCNHCASPACVAHCPTGAMYIDEDETVQHNDDICIGCRTCVSACPYSVPQYFEDEDIVRKCNMCQDLTSVGENPACVDACRNRCLEWGDLDVLRAKHPNAVSDISCLPDSSLTTPSVLIEVRDGALDPNYRIMMR